MGAFEATRLAEALSADTPCGPDLDAEGDPEYLQCMAFVEGLLPLSFFSRDEDGRQQVFDRTSIDFPAVLPRIGALLERTRDLRLLTLYGRLATLNRDLAGLAAAIEASAILLCDEWEHVHPRGEDGDFTFRSAVLQAFDDMPTIVLPLQHIALADSRRHGTISFRTVMVANGEAAAPNDDAPVDRGAIERALAEADIEVLQTLRKHVATVEEAVGTIRTVSIANAGYAQSVSLERLGGLTGRILALIDPVIRTRTGLPVAASAAVEAGTAPVESEPAQAGAAGRIGIASEASAALAAAARYLRRAEPSSPAELLVRQAQMLVGKSFLEVMSILVPVHAEAATIGIGTDRALQLSYSQLAAVPPDESVDPDSTVASADAEESGLQDQVDAKTFQARTRHEAVELLKDVGIFYRNAEPSSPIPLLLDRARGMIERDFLSILKDVLPGLGAAGSDG